MDYGQFFVDTKTCSPSKIHVDRRIIVEEVITNPYANTTLIRKITCRESCGEDQGLSVVIERFSKRLVSGDIKRENLQVQLLYNSDNETNILCSKQYKQTYKPDDSIKLTNFTEEPMDLDPSNGHYVSREANTRLRHLNSRKKYSNHFHEHSETIPFVPSVDEPSISKSFIFLLVLLSLFTVAGIYIVAVGDRYILVNRHLQSENIRNELLESVLFQYDAISRIISNIENIEQWRGPIKVLPFVGTTGVGKTFTANIIKKHFYTRLIHDLKSKHLYDASEQQHVIENLNSCCCNLIIIDDLRGPDVHNLIRFVNNLPKYQVVLIIPIFNIQETTDDVDHMINTEDYRLIRDELYDSKLKHEIMLFDVLEYQVVVGWLRNELYKRGVNEDKHDSIINSIVDEDYVKFKGFKGLQAKLKLAIASS